MQLIKEFLDELRAFFARGGVADIVVPPIVFTAAAVFLSTTSAAVAASAYAAIMIAWRVARGQSFWYAVAGLAGIGLSVALVVVAGDAESFFWPSIAVSGVVTVLCVVSLVVRKPFVAWSSHWYRGWPCAWYWHPQVRPAYTWPTVAWAFFFATRFGAQLWSLQGDVVRVAIVDQIFSWPATTALLLGTFVYGKWKLSKLKGPSVEEFKNNTPPPWTGQQKGY